MSSDGGVSSDMVPSQRCNSKKYHFNLAFGSCWIICAAAYPPVCVWFQCGDWLASLETYQLRVKSMGGRGSFRLLITHHNKLCAMGLTYPILLNPPQFCEMILSLFYR